jgi:hypothetical protein
MITPEPTPYTDTTVLQHDIIIMISEDGYRLYIDNELQIVFGTLVKEHEHVFLKVNFHSKDVKLISPPKNDPDVTKLIEDMKAQADVDTMSRGRVLDKSTS